jgi:predicted transcriptional regulator of viral defense system
VYYKENGCFMIPELSKFEIPYITMQTLHTMLQGYRNPRDCISRLVKNNVLIRLKNGFFLIKNQIENRTIPFEQIANLLYGPSYLSLEYAMSFYGMIPEAVYVRTSMTVNRSKHFHTQVGSFSYYQLSLDRYFVGVAHKKNELGGFNIATPEKALADHVFQLCQGMGHEELLTDLIESKRIELETLKSLDKVLMQQIAKAYHSKIIQTLAEVITSL